MIKKLLLPAMIGAALVAGVTSATADVTAMGHIDTSFVGSKDKNRSGDNLNNLVCTTCSFGFKGSEDLGNGLSAIFKIDFQYDTTERDKGLTDRDQWLGMGTNFGKIRIGTISTSYKSHGAMLDPIYRTSVQGRDWGLQSRLQAGAGDSKAQGRATNTIRYDSPTFAGFMATGHYTVQDETDADSSADSPWGLGGQWKGGGFLVFADYITSDAGKDDSAWKVGGRWGFSKFAIFGQYEGDNGAISQNLNIITDNGLIQGQVDDTGAASDKGDSANTWFLGGTAGFGNNLIYAAYGQGANAKGARYVTGADIGDKVNTKYDSWEIVGVHSLSKRTKAYAGYVQQNYKNSGLDKKTAYTLGMKHTF